MRGSRFNDLNLQWIFDLHEQKTCSQCNSRFWKAEDRGNMSLLFLLLHARFPDRYEISGIEYGEILKQLERFYQGQVKHPQHVTQHSLYIKFCWRLLSTPASRVFLYSRKTLHELSKILVELSLHVARMQFEPRPNSRELGTASSVMIISLSTKECSHLKKLVWCAKTRLTSQEVWAAATSKIWRNSARVSFSPSHLILQVSISSYKFSKHLHTFPVRIA